MKSVGILCEYNPFHKGHLYHIKKAKELFPHSVLILVLNGYFLERGEVSLLKKEDKTKLALEYGVDLVIELPVVFGTQSADIFAEKAFQIFSQFQVSDVLFGSERNDVSLLIHLAKKELEPNYNEKVKQYLKEGINYPTALSKAFDTSITIKEPNDLLGISYAKAVLKNNLNIQLHTIKRTNNYHDTTSNQEILSASNIRYKLKQKEDISFFVPKHVTNVLLKINEEKLWNFLKFRIMTDKDLSIYMTVDEGIEKRLIKACQQSKNIQEFIKFVKTKRYTYNKIRRMIIHILLGFTKNDNNDLNFDYFHILGFNEKGRHYLSYIRKDITLPFQNKTSKIYEYEKKAAFLYEELTDSKVLSFELNNKPIIK